MNLYYVEVAFVGGDVRETPTPLNGTLSPNSGGQGTVEDTISNRTIRVVPLEKSLLGRSGKDFNVSDRRFRCSDLRIRFQKRWVGWRQNSGVPAVTSQIKGMEFLKSSGLRENAHI